MLNIRRKKTLREFHEACLTPLNVLSADQIRSLRHRENFSQPVFARYLNVSRNLISDWERGAKEPGGAGTEVTDSCGKKWDSIHRMNKKYLILACCNLADIHLQDNMNCIKSS